MIVRNKAKVFLLDEGRNDRYYITYAAKSAKP